MQIKECKNAMSCNKGCTKWQKRH